MRKEFKIGQRVRLTILGLQRGLQGHATKPIGRVMRIEPDQPLRVWVRRFGLKGIDSYHVDFWESEQP